MQYLLIPFLGATVALTIHGDLAGEKRLVYTFKPISTLIVIAIALLGFTSPGSDPSYTWAIALGLLFSLGGDVALMFQGNRAFLYGVAFFLVAQIVYSLVFGLRSGLQGPIWWYASLLALIGALFYMAMFTHLGKMKAPVGIYALVISIMVLTAVSTRFSGAFSTAQSWFILSGALLFYVSDVILAVARFARPFRLSRLFNLSTYYGGQLLIALSTSFALGLD